ncbi:MAG: PEP-utilizing enzyme [Candidatus Aenigmarchaeota archaeon]|nr:PEP-utilizing enzyme [Candidatus Aenigmarchaeota archaeon]
MPSDYSSLTVKELEQRIEKILGKQRHQDDLFRAVVLMGQMDLAKFIYHDKKHQPETRFVQGKPKSSETAAFGQALVQLLLLMKSRGMDFPEVFRYALEHMEDDEYKARSPQNPKEIRGVPAFRGMARGTAYVVSGKNPIDRAPRGSVLVLEHADSQISHMIKDFSAVVSDQGGRLCHLAIVAREMKIPAIVGTGNATSLIRTGDQVHVDANSGRVTVLK